MLNAAEIVIRFKDDFSATTAKAEKEFAKFGTWAKDALKFAGVAATATAAVAGLTKQAADFGDKINEMRQKTGMAAEQLSVLKYAAEVSNTSFEGVAIGLKQMSKAAFEAASGGREQAAVFQRLGVSVRDLSGHVRKTDDLLGDLTDRFAAMPDGIEKSALAMKIFGKAGTDMIPLLDEGRSGMARFTDEATRFGLVINDQAAKASDEFNDALTRLKSAFDGLVVKVGMQIIPVVTPVVEGASKVASGISLKDFIVSPGGAIGFAAGKQVNGTIGAQIGKLFSGFRGDPGAGLRQEAEDRKQIAGEYIPEGPQNISKEERDAIAKLAKELLTQRLDMEEIIRNLASALGSAEKLSEIQMSARKIAGTGLMPSGSGIGMSLGIPGFTPGIGIPSPAFGIDTFSPSGIAAGMGGIQSMREYQTQISATIEADNAKTAQHMRDKLTNEFKAFGKAAGSIYDAIFAKGKGDVLFGRDSNGKEHELKDAKWMEKASSQGWDVFYKQGTDTMKRLQDVFLGWINSIGRNLFEKMSSGLASLIMTGSARSGGSGGLLGALPAITRGLGRVPVIGSVGRTFGKALGLTGLLGAGAAPALGGTVLSAGAPLGLGMAAPGMSLGGSLAGLSTAPTLGGSAGFMGLGISGAATAGIGLAVAGAVLLGFKLFGRKAKEAEFQLDPNANRHEQTIFFYAANQTYLVRTLEALNGQIARLKGMSPKSVVMTGLPDAIQSSNQFRRGLGGVLMDDDI